MPMRIASLFGRDPAGGLPALFQGRRISYSFNTRAAIRQACDLLGLQSGDEVLAPAFNCGSELDPLLHAGLTVVLYPVDRQTHVDIAAIEAGITSRTRAIYLIHYFGFLQPATASLRALCDARGLFLIEDCALSLLSGANPANGSAGDISLFCFYKFFPVIGGGALVINNSRITSEPRFDKRPSFRITGKALLRASIDMALGAERRHALMRRLRPGRPAPVAPPVTGANSHPDMPSDYYFDDRLLNTRINSLTAHQIPTFDISGAIAIRRSNYLTYLAAFADRPGITPLFQNLPDETCPLSMPILVENR
ncbi:MAG: DegT/DnrJ/EryC1/StrS family aminotransferase, partial [Paracoccaceae bacterium]